MEKIEKRTLSGFTQKELRFFESLRKKETFLSEYRRFFNITMLVGITGALIFLSTVI